METLLWIGDIIGMIALVYWSAKHEKKRLTGGEREMGKLGK